MVDLDGSYEFSSIRSVTVTAEKEWKIFPSLVKDKLTAQFENESGTSVRCAILDLNGRTLQTSDYLSGGTLQKKDMSLTSGNFPPGVYLMRISSGEIQKVFKFVKE